MREFKVNNWLAIDGQGKYITIDKVTDIHKDYFCPSCGEVVHGRALESELVERHFYHLQNNNLQSCNCEQAYKRYWKDRLITVGEMINISFLGEITCISKEIDYKINDNIKDNIYIKTSDNKNVLFLFEKNKQVENSNLNYTIYYIDYLYLKMDKSNLLECMELLHSEDLNILNNNLKIKIQESEKQLLNINKETKTLNNNININKFKELQQELYKANYLKEFELYDNVIKSLQSRQGVVYKYKGNIVNNEEINALNRLLGVLKGITNYNIDLDPNILKSINYKIYNKGYYLNSWSRSIYFDFIKPIGQYFNTYIKEAENIININ